MILSDPWSINPEETTSTVIIRNIKWVFEKRKRKGGGILTNQNFLFQFRTLIVAVFRNSKFGKNPDCIILIIKK